MLRSLEARAIVVGHSVTGDGRILARFGGRVIGIDVGMGDVYGGNLGALEVGPDGSLTALYPDRREELVPAAARAARVRRGAPARLAGGSRASRRSGPSPPSSRGRAGRKPPHAARDPD